MYRWLRTISVSILGAATIECTGAGAAQVGIEPSDASGSHFKIVISGPINLATLVDFSRAIVDPRIAKTSAPAVELDSPGGSIPAAMAIGGFVRNGGLRTMVARERTCDSACALILVAGIERRAGSGSVSIHRPRFEAGRAGDDAYARASERYDEVLASMRTYLKHMGPGDRLVDAMLAVPAGRFKALSHRELQAFGLSGSGSRATSRVALRVARLHPSVGTRMTMESNGGGKHAKPRRGRSLAQQRLLRAVAAEAPPGVWPASAHRSRVRAASGRAARGRRQGAGNLGRRVRAPFA